MLVNILVAVFAVALIAGVFIYSYYQHKDEREKLKNEEERTVKSFILEFFNHFGDGSNYRR